ncbi:hypothetical protein [Lysobacter gummosus]
MRSNGAAYSPVETTISEGSLRPRDLFVVRNNDAISAFMRRTMRWELRP